MVFLIKLLSDVFIPPSHFLLLFGLLLFLGLLQVLFPFLIVYFFLLFLFDLLLDDLFLLVFGSSLLIIHEDVSVVHEKFTTCSELSFVFVFLLLFLPLSLKLCFFFDSSLFLPLHENVVCNQRTYIMRLLLDLFSESNLFLSSSILASISTLSC